MPIVNTNESIKLINQESNNRQEKIYFFQYRKKRKIYLG